MKSSNFMNRLWKKNVFKGNRLNTRKECEKSRKSMKKE